MTRRGRLVVIVGRGRFHKLSPGGGYHHFANVAPLRWCNFPLCLALWSVLCQVSRVKACRWDVASLRVYPYDTVVRNRVVKYLQTTSVTVRERRENCYITAAVQSKQWRVLCRHRVLYRYRG